MVIKRRSSKDYRSSLRYWWISPDVESFEPDNPFSNEDVHHQHSKSHANTGKRTETKSSTNTVSTAQFVSAIAGIWDRVSQTEVLQTNTNSKHGVNCPIENFLSYSEIQNKRSISSVAVEKLSTGPSSSAKSDFEDLKTIKKMLCYTFCERSINKCSLLIDSYSNMELYALDKVTGVGHSSDSGNKYGIMIMDPYLKETANKLTTEGCPQSENGYYIKEKYFPSDKYSACGIKSSSMTESDDSSRSENLKLVKNEMHLPDPQFTTYTLQPQQAVTRAEELVATSSTAGLQGLQSDYSVQVLNSTDSAFGLCQQSTDVSCVSVESSGEISTSKDHIVHENCKSLIHEVVDYDDDSLQCWLSMHHKLRHAFAGSKHALAGALAGTTVSLCLHPVDTIKTIIQASGSCQRSLCDIVKTIISERGILGLYRGIATNLASSTPISAIYTYTYESVKGSLLPILPKEYHSFAHCIAGGCSSIATSFVFTPSERIKQQMQVGPRYQNCWNAFIGCVGKGGLASLYTGWGAVLCRNIPHSVIKFYTYESLKKLFVTSSKPNASPNTVQTLLCGGLAGSTAALFTTPFDVVKTRLQTQVPGTLAKYDGVLHALQEIGREEGLQGLYRGLTPRLAMYVSQGAIFFASYEFLKAVFFLEKPRAPQAIENEEDVDPVPFKLLKLNS